MDIIDVLDLASYLGSAIDPARADFLVTLANDLVTEVYGSATPAPARVRAITVEVAARAYRNPGGFSSETIDDYTYRRDADTRQAGVYLTDDERSQVERLAGVRSSSGAFTIRPA